MLRGLVGSEMGIRERGYPGGPEVDRLAREGAPKAFAFPRSAPGDGLDFSFSGLKTSLLYKVRDLGEEQSRERLGDLAASYQEAIVDTLVGRNDDAFVALDSAFAHGYAVEEAESEPELAPLRSDPRYQQLSAKYKK